MNTCSDLVMIWQAWCFGSGLDLAIVEAPKLADLVNGQGSGLVDWVEVEAVGRVGWVGWQLLIVRGLRSGCAETGVSPQILYRSYPQPYPQARHG